MKAVWLRARGSRRSEARAEPDIFSGRQSRAAARSERCGKLGAAWRVRATNERRRRRQRAGPATRCPFRAVPVPGHRPLRAWCRWRPRTCPRRKVARAGDRFSEKRKIALRPSPKTPYEHSNLPFRGTRDQTCHGHRDTSKPASGVPRGEASSGDGGRWGFAMRLIAVAAEVASNAAPRVMGSRAVCFFNHGDSEDARRCRLGRRACVASLAGCAEWPSGVAEWSGWMVRLPGELSTATFFRKDPEPESNNRLYQFLRSLPRPRPAAGRHVSTIGRCDRRRAMGSVSRRVR